jgi:hypothetical protein
VPVSAQPVTGFYVRLGASVNIMQVDPLTSFGGTAASGVDPPNELRWHGCGEPQMELCNAFCAEMEVNYRYTGLSKFTPAGSSLSRALG